MPESRCQCGAIYNFYKRPVKKARRTLIDIIGQQ